MKTVVNKNKLGEKPLYPKIKFLTSNPNLIVLFTREGEGVSLTAGIGTVAGEYSEGWEESLFEEFHGQVILEN